MKGGVPTRMKVLGGFFLAGLLASAAAIVRAQIQTGSALFALALYGVSFLIFQATCAANRRRPLTVAFTPDIPVHLVADGPYRFVRHPFYAAYCLTWLAGFVATYDPLLFVVFAVMTFQYVQAARLEERKFQGSHLSAAYCEYRRATGMFVPCWKVSR